MSYSIHIVTYNSEPYLSEVLERTTALQPAADALIIVDNASTDETISIVEAFQKEHPNFCTFLRNAVNVGFARAHNQAIALALRKSMEFALILNPDVYLEAEFPKHILRHFEDHQQTGSAVGKLLRMEPEQRDRSRTVDSTGLRVHRSMRVVDRGSGEQDKGQFDSAGEVFGGTGAALFLRLSAAIDTASDGQVFDERFMNYKEDVDLAWRLRWRGWSCWYEPESIGYHLRSHRGGALRDVIRQRSQRSSATRRSSYRNHYWVMIKDIPLRTLFVNFPWLVPFEFAQALYLLCMEPATLQGAYDAIASLPIMLKLRYQIQRTAVSDIASMGRWVG